MAEYTERFFRSGALRIHVREWGEASAPPLVLVTHHLDEVPPGMTHVLMLRNGQVVAKGPIGRHLTAANLSECFGLPLQLERRADGRFSAWNAPAPAVARDRS